MAQAQTTTDHDVIRRWTEERGGRPATVKRTAGEEPGILRIDFLGYSGGESLEQIGWEDFFETFEEQNLAFLHQETTDDGELSRFCKLVSRESE